MLKSEQIQAEIDSKNAAIDQEATNGQQTNHDQIIQWRNEISVLQMQLSDQRAVEAQQQDAQVQQQAQAAQIGGLKETLRSIFEAAFPKDETVKVIGLTEYESTQQTFNQLIDQAVDEDQTALYAAFNTQLEQRDERFRLLTLQALDVQRQLEEAKSFEQHQDDQILAQEEEINKLTELNHSLQQIVDDHDEQLRQRDEEIQRLKQHEFELQQEIANVKKPAQIIDITPTAPSESLSDKIAAAKIASVTKFSNLYSDVTYTDGTKQVVHNSMLTALEIPVLPTLEPVASQNVEQSANSEQVIHPSEENTATHTEGDPSSAGNQPVEQVVAKTAEEAPVTFNGGFVTVTREEHEALKARVARIEAHANLPVAV